MLNKKYIFGAEMNPHSKWLRQWAVELRKEGVIGGATTAEQAANEIDALQAHRDRLLELHLQSQSETQVDGGK